MTPRPSPDTSAEPGTPVTRAARSRRKRGIDVIISFLGLIVLSPIIVLVAVAIRLSMGSPVLFRQSRPGLNGRSFSILKFRTMTNAPSGTEGTSDDSVRLTRLGKLLRSTSLDELPELLNILRGDMSLVGPRPLLEEYLPLYSPEQARRHLVRPGLTGWAQVNGRNALSWEDKFELDCWYVDNWSPLLDLRILLKTITVTLGRSGIGHGPADTMPRFTGTRHVPTHPDEESQT